MQKHFDGIMFWDIPKGFRQHFYKTEAPDGWTLVRRFCRIGKRPLILCKKL